MTATLNATTTTEMEETETLTVATTMKDGVTSKNDGPESQPPTKNDEEPQVLSNNNDDDECETRQDTEHVVEGDTKEN